MQLGIIRGALKNFRRVVLGRRLAVSVAACGLGNSGLHGWIRGLCVALYEQVKQITKEKKKIVQRNLLQTLLQGTKSGFLLEIEEIDSVVCYQILFPFKLFQNIE